MDRAKPPVLTSPWKIGFFVALMLFTVSIGVAFFVAKSFGVVWPPLNEWGWEGVLQGSGFAFGLTPIMVMVVLSSLAAYFLITAAVRKYRRYLDSGKDYRHLMQTLRGIDDLDNPAQLGLLDKYSELREFLLGARNQLAKRRDNLDQREKALASAATDAARGREEEIGQRVNEQSQFLVTAVSRHPNGAFENLQDVTLPALKKVEDVVRNALKSQSGAAPDLGMSSQHLALQVAEIMREIELNSRAARDIEQELRRLANSGMPGTPDSGEVRRGLDAVITNFEAVDKLTQNLSVLGEEAKGVAINTALKAGTGGSSQADVVQLAEDVKDVASKFKTTAQAYTALTRELRGALTNVEVGLGDLMAGANSYEGSIIGSVADRIGRWAERSMLLSEKAHELTGAGTDSNASSSANDMSGFERHDSPFETSSYPGFGSASNAPTAKTDSTPSPAEEFQAFDDKSATTFETHSASPVLKTVDEAEPTGFETLDESAPIFDGEAESEAGIDGLQNKDRGVFDEMSTQDEMFAELDADTSSTPIDEVVEGNTVGSAHQIPTDDADRAPAAAAEFDTPALHDEAVEPAAVDTDYPDSDLYDITTEAMVDGVVDLYALGAEDFDPALHQ